MGLVAGIDSSTQSCKVVVLDSGTGELVRSGRAAHPDGTEVDPSHWWDALQEAIFDAGGLADVTALSVSGQQHGLVLLDAHGQVLRPALLWNDTRSASSADALVAELGAAELAGRCGSVPVASFTITKLRWVRDQEPAIATRVAAVALPHDWLSWRLRGYGPAASSPLGPDLEQLVTDRSDASGTGYWSPRLEDYDLELFELAFSRPARSASPEAPGHSGSTIVLPRVAAPNEKTGSIHADYAGGRAGITLGAGAGDNAGGALGLGATEGDVVISLGTSGTVYAVANSPIVDESGTIAGFADASGLYLPIAVTLNAARILSTTANLLGVDLDEFARLALAARPGSDGVVLIPYFEGERTPNLPDATASFHGLSLASSTRENLARAGIEAMLCSLAGGLEAILSQGVRAKRLLLIGGAAQNEAVQRIAAEVFDVPVQVPAPGEYVARGAAVQACWVATGTRPDWQHPGMKYLEPNHLPQIREQFMAVGASLGH